MKIYTIDELAKGRGPDKKKRKSRGTISYFSGGKEITGFDYKQMKKQGAKGLSKISFAEAEENRKNILPWAGKPKGSASDWGMGSRTSREEDRKHWKSVEPPDLEKSLTEQDEKNIDSIRELVSKRPDLQKALEGPVKWTGKVGFDECVAHLSGKKGITNAKSLCGYLKEEARNRGTLKPSHMGKIEKKEYKKNTGKK